MLAFCDFLMVCSCEVLSDIYDDFNDMCDATTFDSILMQRKNVSIHQGSCVVGHISIVLEAALMQSCRPAARSSTKLSIFAILSNKELIVCTTQISLMSCVGSLW